MQGEIGNVRGVEPAIERIRRRAFASESPAKRKAGRPVTSLSPMKRL